MPIREHCLNEATFRVALRDYFAALAMTTILKGNDDYIARRAYELADAMMKERDL